MLKRLYHVLAWLAVANLFAVGGLVGYLFASGKLNAERVNQIAVVLRGEFPKPQVQTTRPAVEDEKPQTSREELARLEARKRYYELISDRHRRDLDDRNSLGQTIQMDVDRHLEQIQTKEQEITKQTQQVRQAAERGGFQQTLEIYSDMEPKLARDTLKGIKDADAAQVLLQMDSGRRKKIFNACKTPEEKAWLSRMMLAMRGLDVAQPAAATVDAGKAGAASGAGPEAAARANTPAMSPTAVSNAAGPKPAAR
jgi:flagellar motility protein MotE (MotC chaperone)